MSPSKKVKNLGKAEEEEDADASEYVPFIIFGMDSIVK